MTSQFRDESTFSSEVRITGAIAKRLPHAKNQLSATGSFFNQFVTERYIYILRYTHINRVLIVWIGGLNDSICKIEFFIIMQYKHVSLLALSYRRRVRDFILSCMNSI